MIILFALSLILGGVGAFVAGVIISKVMGRILENASDKSQRKKKGK